MPATNEVIVEPTATSPPGLQRSLSSSASLTGGPGANLEWLADQVIALTGRQRTLLLDPEPRTFAEHLHQRGGEVQWVRWGGVEEVIRDLRGAEGNVETVMSLGWLETLAAPELASVLTTCAHVTRRNLLVRLPGVLRDGGGWDRGTFERVAFAAGFRKHPLYQALVPYEVLEDEPRPWCLLFEKIPSAAWQRYPLSVLAAERDLHMDMLREAGIRSDAHLARYGLAREWVPPGGVVVDVACGLGYGSAVLAAGTGAAQVLGVDCSRFAVDYATANYGVDRPGLEFRVGDATALEGVKDGSVDLAVSFETLEHLTDPEALLRELARVLKPGGRLIASVPNLWIDEQGRNPVPWHLHVYDARQFRDQIRRHFQLARLYRQNAGGGWKRPQPRKLRRIEAAEPEAADCRDAEWWIAVGERAGGEVRTGRRLGRPAKGVVLDEEGRYGELFGRVFERLGLEVVPGGGMEPEAIVALRPDVVILSREWTREWRLTAAAARRAGIPVVYVMDGVLEWSYVWNNLSYIRPHGTMLQPLLASDLCVIGRHPARLLAGLGLGSRIHVVGLPRLDGYNRQRTVEAGRAPRVVVATARTAGHNVEQQVQVRRGLRDLRDWFAAHPGVEPVWRVAPDLAEELALKSDAQGRFEAVLREASALVTFPSTCVLEGMLKGLPVAQVEYRAVPMYVNTAWEIRSAEQIPGVLQELLHPPANKLAYQDACLADELEEGDATERLAEVIHSALSRPLTGLAEGTVEPRGSGGRLDYRLVHSELSTFALSPLSTLQYELEAAHAVIQRLKHERVDRHRAVLELAEALAEDDLERWHHYTFIDHVAEAKLSCSPPGSLSVGPLAHGGQSVRTIFLHPPAALTFEVPVSAAGKLSLAVGMHPEVWDNPESGACRFRVEVDGAVLAEVVIDPAHVAADRGWHRLDVRVPAGPAGGHRFCLRTEGVGSVAYRWALWRSPVFVWGRPRDLGDGADAVDPALRIPEMSEPGRTVA